MVLKGINLYDCNETELKFLCRLCGISDIATTRFVLRYAEHQSLLHIAQQEFVEEETIKQSLRRTRNKIKATFR